MLQPRLFVLDALGEGGWLKATRLEGYAPRATTAPGSPADALFIPRSRRVAPDPTMLQTSHPRGSEKFARRSRASSQEGGIGVAWLSNRSSSEARIIAECILRTRLSSDAVHSSIASSMAAVLTTSRLASTSSLNCLCCSRAVSSSSGFTQSKEAQTVCPKQI